GRAAQSELQSPRREPAPFRPRAVNLDREAEPRGPLTFNRVLLEAAAAARSRALEDGEGRGPSDGRSANRARASSRPRETAPAPDVEALVAEAYDRGLREGAAAARDEDAEAQERQQASQME